MLKSLREFLTLLFTGGRPEPPVNPGRPSPLPSTSSRTGSSSGSSSSNREASASSATSTYRPRAPGGSSSSGKIKFESETTTFAGPTTCPGVPTSGNAGARRVGAWQDIVSDQPNKGLQGLHDAFTGAPLNPLVALYQCQKCKVYYHRESYDILREVNGSRCVSCQSTNIVQYLAGAKPQEGKFEGREYKPPVVTLTNFKNSVNTVVTFEGRVRTVRESRRGNDFAVMFEDKSWTKGFKLVFFRGTVEKMGGRNFINSLSGRSIKVRGLLLNHETFGYEIVISERTMILEVH